MNRRFPAWTRAPSSRALGTSISVAGRPSILTPPWEIRRLASLVEPYPPFSFDTGPAA